MMVVVIVAIGGDDGVCGSDGVGGDDGGSDGDGNTDLGGDGLLCVCVGGGLFQLVEMICTM